MEWQLLPALGLFIGLALWAYVSYKRETKRASSPSMEYGEISAGTEARKRFYLLILLSTSARVISLVFEFVISSQDSENSQTNTWMVKYMHSIYIRV